MQELSKTYQPSAVEEAIYKNWMENRCFASTPNEKEAFTIVIPPPNVTGQLHMGHMLNNTIQDVLVRRARMLGKNACWVPGTDHASIATEAKVVGMLREKGIKKSEIGREEFLKYAFEWKDKYGGIILEQLKKLGASCDWDRTRFTMDPKYYEAVIKTFVDFYNKGYIYRGLRMINWDCEARTALSNEEVIYAEGGERSFLYHVQYAIEGTDEHLVIATQRPETIPGDVAVAVNPKDERYKHLIGKKAVVPFVNRAVPIIGDDYVELEFGTGCLKVTPAHDVNDYEIGQRHNLPVIDTMNDDGTMNAATELDWMIGMDRFEARKQFVKRLDEAGLLLKKEDFTTRIGRSERTNSVVEPKLSLQWFIRMKDISGRALAAVENDEVRLHPAKFKNTYRHWMENVKDWCISRQLWWGHRIPAWYFGEGENDFVVAMNETEALEAARSRTGNANLQLSDLRQDEDVLDTWASSWLWPIAVFDGLEDYDPHTGKMNRIPADLKYYYPTDVLVTGPDILFFWVARMIIAGYEYTDQPPFRDVYLTGIVRDKLGRKMSKQLGNSPDPLDLISNFGADSVRVGMLLSSAAGNDLLFDESLCEQGSKFTNKVWNSFRLIKGWTGVNEAAPQESKDAVEWFSNKLAQQVGELNDLYTQFRISEALMATYKLVWDDFCSTYLEIIKPKEGRIAQETLDTTVHFFEQLLKIMHPFVPFITEELWKHIADRKEGDFIMFAAWPEVKTPDLAMLNRFEQALNTVTALRNFRNEKGISMRDALELSSTGHFDHTAVIGKLANVAAISKVDSKPEGTLAIRVGTQELFAPIGAGINVEAEVKKLQEELNYAQGFLQSVAKKLGNERFVQNAKAEVIEAERKKQADAEAKIRLIEEQLRSLQN
ncbi:MAG: valine--tRNA ligase [Bacteroidia bacterium]|nr:valine--tRNA ligase [Bacteroidia bacterium]